MSADRTPDVAVFTVAVTHTDRSRAADGTYTTFTAVVDVLATDDVDAGLVACQMVHAVRPGGMPLGHSIIRVAI